MLRALTIPYMSGKSSKTQENNELVPWAQANEIICPVHPGRLSGFPLTQYRSHDEYGTIFFDAGQGHPIVFIHGLGGNLTHWQFVAPELAKHHRVIGLDLPGFGETRRPSRPYTYDLMADAVFDLLKQRGVEKFTVVGHSFGGAVATLMTLREPERVTGLVVVNPAGFNRFPRWMQEGSRVALHPVVTMPGLLLSVKFILSQVCRGEGPGVDAFARSSTRLKGGWKFLTDLTHAAWSLRRDIVSRHFLEELGQLTLPVHMVWGDDDRLLDSSQGSEIARGLPAGRITRLPGVGHMPIFERPDAVIAAVRDVILRARTWRIAERRAVPAGRAEDARRPHGVGRRARAVG